jgi:hypothetical protein
MGQLKPISRESIPRALDKAERYRLLNEPFLAESICLDVLAVEPDDQRALVIYVLSMTDQFASESEGSARRVRAAIDRLKGEYDRAYYSGIAAERRATAVLNEGGFGHRDAAWHDIHEAMSLYERADALQSDPTNDDAVLRYNTCVRLIERHRLTEPAQERHEYPLE